jgi:hypothetical protein
MSVQVYRQEKDGAIECDFETVGSGSDDPPPEGGFAKEQ